MESVRDRMSRAVSTRKEEAEEAKKKYYESSQKRLLKILEKKLQTSFIGALSEFEEVFGSLWGRGKDESELTEDELHARKLWNDARTNILNNGNNQIRAVKNELNQYTVSWNRHQYEFKSHPREDFLTSRPEEDKDGNR